MKTRRFFMLVSALFVLGGPVLASDATESKKMAVSSCETPPLPPVYQYMGDPYKPCATCG